MTSQTKSGFCTEGNQYALDRSYYVLDTGDGQGLTLEGPVNVIGNLTATGNLTTTGKIETASSVTAVSLFTPSVNSLGAMSITASNGLSVSSLTGNVSVSSPTLAEVRSGSNFVGANNLGVAMGSSSGSLDITGPPRITPSLTCPSYLNPNVTSYTVTRTVPVAVTQNTLTPLPINGLGSAQVTLPVASLFAGGCFPQVLKIVITNLNFGASFIGSCSPSAPFSLYFYQGTATDYDTVTSAAVATFVYTNQAGAINSGGYCNIPRTTLAVPNASQIVPSGGDIKVFYFSGFQGFFGNATGTQASFAISVSL